MVDGAPAPLNPFSSGRATLPAGEQHKGVGEMAEVHGSCDPRFEKMREILSANIDSGADVGASVYFFLPVRLLMKDQFRSDLRIRNVKAPVLILHGEKDNVVPIAFGERLFGMISAEKKFVRFPDGQHYDLDRHGGLQAAVEFLNN